MVKIDEILSYRSKGRTPKKTNETDQKFELKIFYRNGGKWILNINILETMNTFGCIWFSAKKIQSFIIENRICLYFDFSSKMREIESK